MLHALRTLLAIALTVCALSAYADPPSRVGRLNYTAGAVSFAPGEAPGEWAQAVVNRPLTSGDRLWTDHDARAELHVGSSALRLAPVTSVDVLNLDDHTLQVRLAQGAINVRVRDLAQDDVIEIATPTGAVLLRQPGSYRISADPQSAVSRVLVNFGQAEIVTPTQTVTVPSSQTAVVSAQAPIAFELAGYAQQDEFDRWSTELDRREDRVASTRYVSRDMTGYEDLDQYGAWRTLPEYGAVWVPTRVAPGWAPYRHGHWVWVSPWGWTWVDEAPWGFAPFHYGRWVWLDNYWGWAPGPIVRRPVYAPALVAFVGGAGFSVAIHSGPTVGWFPLGWREPFIPWYRSSPAYVRNVNVTHVTNVTNIYTTNVNYVNRRRANAVTVVPQQAFVSARRVEPSSLSVPQQALANAQVIRDRQPAEPIRASLAPERAGRRPPSQAMSREVVAVNPPAPAAAREVPAFRDRNSAFSRSDDAEPRVRVLRRERADADGNRARQSPTPGPENAPRSQGTAEPTPRPQTRGAPLISGPSRNEAAPAAERVGPQTVPSPRSAPVTAAPPGRAAESASVLPGSAPATVAPSRGAGAPPARAGSAEEADRGRFRRDRAPDPAQRHEAPLTRPGPASRAPVAPPPARAPVTPPPAAQAPAPPPAVRVPVAPPPAAQAPAAPRASVREAPQQRPPMASQPTPAAPRAAETAPTREPPHQRQAPQGSQGPQGSAPSPRAHAAFTPRHDPVARAQAAQPQEQRVRAERRSQPEREGSRRPGNGS